MIFKSIFNNFYRLYIWVMVMKKILISLITLVLIYVPKVYAGETWTDVPKDGNAKTEIRYKWYQEELLDNGYMELIDDEYIHFDASDYIVEYSEWMNYEGPMMPNIETRVLYEYTKLSEIRYIQIYNAKTETKDLDFIIDEIKVYKDDKEISYDKKCSTCYQATLDYVNDNNLETKFKMYSYNGYLIIDLLDWHNIKDLSIEITLNQTGSFNIGFSIYKNPQNLFAAYKEFNFNTDKQESFIYKVDTSWTIDYLYSNVIESEQELKTDFDLIFRRTKQEYRKIYTLYHSYFKNRIYYDDNYYADSPDTSLNLIKDENNFKVYYKYDKDNINSSVESNTKPDINVITQIKTIYKESEPKIVYKTIGIDNTKNAIKESNKETEVNTKTILKKEISEKIKTIKIDKQSKYYLIIFITIIFLSIIEILLVRKINKKC